MSTYNKLTKHPHTGVWENATWYDDFFSHHHYGVVFPSDLKKFGDETALRAIAFNPDKVKLETRDEVE